jgi:hypothetical protein
MLLVKSGEKPTHMSDPSDYRCEDSATHRLKKRAEAIALARLTAYIS